MVAESGYRLNRARERQRKRWMTVYAALSTDAIPVIKMGLCIRYREANKDVNQIILCRK